MRVPAAVQRIEDGHSDAAAVGQVRIWQSVVRDPVSDRGVSQALWGHMDQDGMAGGDAVSGQYADRVCLLFPDQAGLFKDRAAGRPDQLRIYLQFSVLLYRGGGLVPSLQRIRKTGQGERERAYAGALPEADRAFLGRDIWRLSDPRAYRCPLPVDGMGG